MKRKLLIFVAILLLFSMLSVPLSAFAESIFSFPRIQFRAGGGGGGGGGGGSHHSSGDGKISPIEAVFIITFSLFVLITIIVTTVKYSILRRKNKERAARITALLQNQNNLWKYDTVYKQVEEAFYAIQKAWSNGDMTPAEKYCSEAQYRKFCSQLSYMLSEDKRNVLEDIYLIEAIPISLYDSQDDANDYVWFSVTGSMIDY